MVYSPRCHPEPFCKYCLICTYCYPSWRPCFMHVIKQRIRDCAHNANTIGSHNNVANCNTWWRHQMETFSALLAICAENSPVTGEIPAQRPVTRNFGVFFICVWINGWVNSREADDLICHRAHYDVTVMIISHTAWRLWRKKMTTMFQSHKMA